MTEIDILLAVYNGERFIEEQIASILGQTHATINLIIRDNASTDQTVSIIQRLAKQHQTRIKLITSHVNQGVVGNFSALMKVSQASYVMFSDADDKWLPNKVELTLQKMKATEGHDTLKPILIHTDLSVVDKDLQLIHPSFCRFSNIDPEKGKALAKQLVQNTITGCTTMVNRALLDLALPIPQEIVMHDWWLGIVAAAFGKIWFIDEPTILYRQHGMNDTGAKRYGLLSYFNRVKNPKERKKLSLNRQKRFRQAETLLTRYRLQLSLKQIELLEAYLMLENGPFFKKRALMIKYGFFKRGFLRNVMEFLPLEWAF